MVNHSHKVGGNKGPGAHEYKSGSLPAHSGKMHKVMHEFKHGELHSGSKKGPKVTSRKQAIAIAISESKKGKR